MKLVKLNIVYCVLIFAAAITGCVDSLPTNPNNVPEIVVYSPASNDTVHVGRNYINYSAGDYAGGSGLSRYEVVVNDDEDNAVVFEKDSVNAFTTIYFDLHQSLLGSTVSYYVRVYNSEEVSATSDKVTNLYVGENNEQPETPDSLWIQRINTSEIKLFWYDTSLNEDGFIIYRKDGVGGTYVPINTVEENESSFTDRGLSPYVVYYYKIASYNGSKLSPFTYEVNTLQAGGNEPYNLTVEAQGATRVLLRWKNISYYTESAYIDIERKHPSATLWTKIKERLVATSEEYTDQTDLSPGTSYDYRVVLTIMDNQAEYKFYSWEVTATTYTIDVPVPADLVASFDPSVNKVLVQWGSYPQHALETQVWRSNKADGVYVLVGTAGSDSTALYDDAISENDVYYYKARFLTTEEFYTGYSEIDTALVGEFRPLAPYDLTIIATENTNEYYLGWQYGTTDIDGFKIYMRKSGNPNWSHVSTTLASKKFDIVTTPDSESYVFSVVAYKGNVNSVYSNEISTSEGVGEFELNGVYDGTDIFLTWTPPSGSSNIAAYIVKRKINWDGEWETIAAVTSAPFTHTDSNVPTKKDIQYVVVALFNDGTEVSSNVKEIGTW